MESFRVAELNCNFAGNCHGWMVVLHGQGLYTSYLVENFRGTMQSICENLETFPSRMICNDYMVTLARKG